MEKEQIEMRSRGIELQEEITKKKERVENIVTYMEECSTIIDDSKVEADKHQVVINEMKERQEQAAKAKKERDAIKKKIAAKKKRERQKSKAKELEENE